MKITAIARKTIVEASAAELRESNTLSDNFLGIMTRAFQNKEPLDEYSEEAEDDEEET